MTSIETITIDESGMTFGPYPSERCFHIEKSALYKDIRQGVKMAEFLLLRADSNRPAMLWVVEAKSSSPRPKSEPDFSQFIAEVREKWIDALSLTLASLLGRHRQAGAELPGPFELLDLSQFDVRFVLVINGHPKGWLPPIQDALRQSLRPLVRIWRFAPTSVVVLNEELASKRQLISANRPS
ncbi:hypothetical protein [Fretibacterium fastidiosum]|uniref:Uncharacterized protein n=1 Tax=Fretibacterium fastidiosum TaxID=651822 RepID=A0AB94IZ45_9BACT|nr:hypothetical protein [Fretibacterium fastidiosum]CBL28980.1 hypothetical protein SY1_23130 [Fretibacterium fastidiosum]